MGGNKNKKGQNYKSNKNPYQKNIRGYHIHYLRYKYNETNKKQLLFSRFKIRQIVHFRYFQLKNETHLHIRGKKNHEPLYIIFSKRLNITQYEFMINPTVKVLLKQHDVIF